MPDAPVNVNEWDSEGEDNYKASASTGDGVFFSLKTKGQEARLRLCSGSCRYTRVFDKDDGTKDIRRKAAWLAILKEVVNGQPVKRVVVYVAGPMVYGLIKKLADDPDVGDPQEYDIKVTRTEQPGSYYAVLPITKNAKPITDEERALIKAANIDWPAICTKGSGVVASNTASAAASQYEDPDPFSDD